MLLRADINDFVVLGEMDKFRRGGFFGGYTKYCMTKTNFEFKIANAVHIMPDLQELTETFELLLFNGVIVT